MDDTEIESDHSTAAERVPVRGAYNITDIGDSAKAGWHELEHRVIKWRNLRWWALGIIGIGVPLWLTFWAPMPLTALFVIAGLCAIPAVKLFTWYMDMAHRWADLQVKRRQVRHR